MILFNISPDLMSKDYEEAMARQEEEDEMADLLDILMLLPLISAIETNLERPPNLKNSRLHKNVMPLPLALPLPVPFALPRKAAAITEPPIVTATPHTTTPHI